jgi:hypothetical protein
MDRQLLLMNHLFFDCLGDHGRCGRCSAHLATSTTALDGEQVALAGLMMLYLTGSRYFNSLGDTFVRFAFGRFSCFSWHFSILYAFSKHTFHPGFIKPE